MRSGSYVPVPVDFGGVSDLIVAECAGSKECYHAGRSTLLANIMKKTAVTLIMAAFGCLAFTGCISHKETIVRDVERTKVEFDNETAARIFYETLSKLPASSKAESTTEVEIPVIFDTEQHVVTGPNAAFNEAVARCDSNKDGKITELEAKIFAAQVAGQHDR